MPKLPKDLAALIYTHLALFAMAFGAAWFVFTQTPKLPIMDEWDLLQSWVESDSTWHWIWAHHNEHRYSLSKALWLGILRTTGYDFAAPQYVSFALLLSSGVLLLWTARGLRGRSHPVDVIFPALLLHFGHGFNLQMGYQLGFVLFAYGIAGWLWCAGRLAQGGGRGWAILSAIYAGMLIPCGGFGLAYTPVVLFWFGYLALRARRHGDRITAGLFWTGFIGIAVYSVWVALTMPKLTIPGTSPFEQPGEFLTGVVGYLASGVGCWPERGWQLIAVSIPVVILYAVAFQVVASRADFSDSRRIIAVAILLVMVGTVLVGAAAARARGGGFIERLSTASGAGLAATILGLIATSVLRPRGRLSWSFGIVGTLLAAGIIRQNVGPGLDWAFNMRHATHLLSVDMRAGQPPLFLAGLHGGSIGVLMGDSFHPQLIALKRAGIPPFADLPDDPPHRMVPAAIPGLPVRWTYSESDWLEGAAPPIIAVPTPPPGAIGLRLRATTDNSHGRMLLVLDSTDRITGASHRVDAQPFYSTGRLHLAFPFTSGADRITLRAGSALTNIVIDETEWIMPVSE